MSKRTYETCGKKFTSRKAANRFARNIANTSGVRVPVYETTDYDTAIHTEQVAEHTPNVESEANARLIAAAPDLLEIVQMYRAAHCGKHRTETGDICVKCTQADEAIRKATGGQS